MYLYKNLGNFGELGYWQFIVAAVQGLAYGGAVATTASAQRKYLKSEGHTQQMSHGAQMTLKEKELQAKQELLAKKGQTELYADMRLKKLVIITIVTLISVTVIGLGTYYALSVGGDDG